MKSNTITALYLVLAESSRIVSCNLVPSTSLNDAYSGVLPVRGLNTKAHMLQCRHDLIKHSIDMTGSDIAVSRHDDHTCLAR
jgi:hypothetical protein